MTVIDAAGLSVSAPAVADVAPAAAPPVAAALTGGVGTGHFFGEESAYWRLMVRGAILLICTLGIYRFWLATDQRRFLWANTEIAGDALEYIGTARELLVGFLIALAVLIPMYAAFFLAALASGIVGALITMIAFFLLVLFAHFAIYRARRYRLTRTVLRGLRLHQTGSAWAYAVYCILCWALTLVTFGLAYPWGQAALERYKMRNTFYGDARGRFTGSGTHLFLRGILLWLVVVAPVLVGLAYAVRSINWPTLAEALERGGDNVIGQIEGVSPNFDAALAFVSIAFVWSLVAAGLLYPAFQAIMLRWWTSGLRFGDMGARSKLRTGQMYALYLRSAGYFVAFGAVVAAAAGIAIGIFHPLVELVGNDGFAEIGGTAGGVIGYVLVMLGSSTLYQVTIKLRLWRLSFETVELFGLEALDGVKAAGVPGSAFGEGLADALDVGGL